jgi:hypothetical protein
MYNQLNMKGFFYTVSVVMVIVWALCYFVYSLETSIHALLFLALLVGLAGLLQKN